MTEDVDSAKAKIVLQYDQIKQAWDLIYGYMLLFVLIHSQIVECKNIELKKILDGKVEVSDESDLFSASMAKDLGLLSASKMEKLDEQTRAF